MNFLKRLDIIKLDNNKTYVVTEMIKKNNIDYLMLIESNENGDLKEEVVYAKIILMPTRKYGIEIIDDEELKIELAKKFLPLFKQDYK